MKRRRTVLALLVPAVILAASCASTGPKTRQPADTGVDIAGIVFHNALNYTVTEVMALVPATGGFAGCGNILPRSDCSTSFTSVDYRRNPILVTWREHGEAQATDEFTVDLPTGAGRDDSFWLEVVIYAPGLAGARFVQR